MQTAGKMKLYWDKTDVVVTTNPDDTISVKMDYKSMYLHSVVFVDFNRDGQFTRFSELTTSPQQLLRLLHSLL